MDAAHFGGGQKDVFGFLLGKEGSHGSLVAQIQFGMGAQHKVVVTLGPQAAHQGGTDQAAMTGNINFCVFIHAYSW